MPTADPVDPPAGPLAALLAGLPAHRRETFEARLARWLPDLRDALARCTSTPRPSSAGSSRWRPRPSRSAPTTCTRLDLERSLEPDWFQRPGMLGYAAYTDRFAGTLAGVAERAPYLAGLGVGYLHLMPLLTPRPAPNDGGYAVQDYRTVRPDLGTVDDLRALTSTLRERGISLCLDLVLNHVAREHEWAERARAGEPRYRDYFYVYPDRTMPDGYERRCPRCSRTSRPAASPGTTTLEGWVWTTFNAYQWDVNWSNPDVLVRVRRHHPASSPTRASRCSGSTRSRSSGSGWAPTARTSRRCTR